ncbi:methylaspartate mutase subunit S [Ruegeria sp.]|uniref:methylaspartate mutase subunit S n=1 Tax=Ruegeria sp. TaxID=1879320 RepID=UPI003B59CF2E
MFDANATYKVVLGVIGADCHAVGNKILTSLLNRAGIEVVNLGVMVSQAEFVTAALAENADAILVSSIYGHGEIDCQGLRERCEAAGIGNILLYVGGNLVIGKQDFETVKSRFEDMGYDRVFPASANIDDVVTLLKGDIELSRVPNLGHNSGAAAVGFADWAAI